MKTSRPHAVYLQNAYSALPFVRAGRDSTAHPQITDGAPAFIRIKIAGVVKMHGNPRATAVHIRIV